MKNIIRASMLLLLMFTDASAFKLGYKLEAFGGKVSGFTDYHIQLPTTVWVTNGIDTWEVPATVHSVLAFPTDGIRTRMKGTAFTQPKGKRQKTYGWEAAVSMTLTQPSEDMSDSDYVLVPSLMPDKYIFGCTTSEARLRDLSLSTSAFVKLNLGKVVRWSNAIGYEYHKYKYDIMGLSGWYDMDLDGSPDPGDFTPYQGMNVLDYKVTYNLLNLETNLEFTSSEGLKLFVGGKWFPLAKAKDLDDHLLRKKTAQSDCHGNGYSLEGGTKINVASFKNGSQMFLAGRYGIIRIKTTGTQTQRFYGDDPGSVEVETGLVIEGIKSEISLKQSEIAVNLEYQF
jgi:hypothetical protein